LRSPFVEIMEEINAFLAIDELNVVAIHCMAGRSRTGTVIASFLLHSNTFRSPDYSIYYFNKRRSQGPSLRLPSQIRQVNNFFNFSQYAKRDDQTYDLTTIINAKMFYLRGIKMSPVPMVGLSNTGYTPIIYIINLSTGVVETTMKSKRKYLPQKAKELSESFTTDILLRGDILMKFHHNTSISGLAQHEYELFKLYFHTSLIHSTSLNFKIDDLDAMDTDDPLSFRHLQVYSPQFSVTLLLEEVLDEATTENGSVHVGNSIENGNEKNGSPENDMQIIINKEGGAEQVVDMKYNLENNSEEKNGESLEIPDTGKKVSQVPKDVGKNFGGLSLEIPQVPNLDLLTLTPKIADNEHDKRSFSNLESLVSPLQKRVSVSHMVPMLTEFGGSLVPDVGRASESGESGEDKVSKEKGTDLLM